MDLRLRCSTSDTSFDVALDVEPSHTISAVRDALVDHARSLGVDVDGNSDLTAWGRRFAATDTVFSSGIATGDDVALGHLAPTDGPGRFATRAVVVSGPDAGSVLLLAPGRHTIGRDPGAEIALTDASVEPAHAFFDVREDTAVRVVPIDGVVDIDDEQAAGPMRVEPGSVIRAGSSVLEISVVRRAHRTDALGTVAHNRTPYRRPVVHARALTPLGKPPEVATKPRFVLASALLPVASGAMLVVISGRIQFLFLVLLSPLLVGWTYLQDRRSGRRRYERDRALYLESVEERVAAGVRALDDELIERRRAAPTAKVLARHAEFLQPRLWERDRATTDFGELRVGVATAPSEVTIDIGAGGDDLVLMANDALAFVHEVGGAPVSIGLDDEPVMAIVGDESGRNAVARSLIAQATALHSPEDLVVAAIVSGGTLADHEWLKWLPHVGSSASPLVGSPLAMWPDEQERLLVDVANLAEARMVDEENSTTWPRVLVLIDEAAEPDRTVLSRVLDQAAAGGIWVLWVGETSDGVPRQADVVLHCGSGSTPSVLNRGDVAQATTEIEPDRFGVDESLALSCWIAPVRDATSATQLAALPRLVPLFDVIPGGRPDAESILEQWTRGTDGLATTVGVGTDGPHVLDLVEQGPHALIAGTSGAGKSEFLQTWVAGLAAAHPPHRLNLLFIDYKGGAFSAAFDALPHNVGTVTNLDAALSLRALTSLRAELDHRMQLLGGDAKDIVELEAVDPDRVPPRLVIIVDEFATLVKEIPDFVAGMVDLAQRGRSLGIHLVLATQRPSGSVNDNILANTNLRISLRVLDNADSTSVIGAPDAAQLPAPLRGRAFVRTGPGQLHPFQAAFGGAPDLVDTGPGQIAVGSFDFSGVQPSGSVPTEGGTTAHTQLEVVVGAMVEAHAQTGWTHPRRPWLEPLPDVVTVAGIGRSSELSVTQSADPGRHVTLGLADRPDRQVQDAWTVDLESSGGLLVFGGGGSGRTTVLRSMAAELAGQGGSDAIRIHVVDAASRALGPLSVLPHVASNLTVDELEPIARLVQVLESEVALRRAALADTHADALSTLRSMRGTPVVPRIVVLIDGLAALRDALDTPDAYEWFNRLVRLTADGRQVGIHFVATSDRRAGLPASVVGSLGSRIVLPMGEVDEAISLGVPRPIASAVDAPAGRAFADDTVVQVAVTGEDPSGPGQVEALTRLASSLSTIRTEPLAELPDQLGGAMEMTDGLRVAIGARDLWSGPAEVDVAAGHLLVTGPAGSGRSSAAAGIARALACAADRPRLVGIGGPASPLAGVLCLEEVAFTRETHAATLEAVSATVDPERRSIEAVVFVDAAEDVGAMDTDRALERLAGFASVRLVVVADTATLARAFSGWLADVKRHRRSLFLQPEGKAEIDAVLGLRAPLRPGQRFPVGRGLFTEGRRVDLVQVHSE